MRRVTAAFVGVITTVSAAWAAEPADVVRNAWNITAASEARYYSWTSDRGTPTTFNTARGSGSEFYVPFAVQLTGKPTDDIKVQILGRGGWVHAHQSTAGLAGTVDTFTDTVVSGTFTYLGINGIQPFVGVTVNAPTGRSVLFGSAANARMDSDLVEVGSFGEGWNIGPTAGFSLPFTASLMFTGSVGYTWRGSFDRERSTAQIDPTQQSLTGVNPGDVITGTVSLGYQGAPWAWSITGTISDETTTTENGLDLYRAGRRYVGTATVAYNWPDQRGQTTVNGSFAHSNRNEVLFFGASALVTELFNTNSDVYRIGVQHLIPVGDTFAFGPTGSYLYRNHNSYDPTTLQFLPAKERFSAGGQARYAASQNVTLNVRGEYVWTHEDDRPEATISALLPPPGTLATPQMAVPSVSSAGWVIAGGANVTY
jgi:hypothetical protein